MENFKIEIINKNNDEYEYSVSIKIPTDGWIDDVYIHLIDGDSTWKSKLDFVSKDDEFAYFKGNIKLNTKALYKYYFTYRVNDSYKSLMNFNDEPYKMSVGFSVPDWAKGKMMYHIFVDRFRRCGDELSPMPNRDIHNDWSEDVCLGPNKDGIWNCDFYGGNIKGIIEKLDYIKSLGVSILYLSPVVLSQSNHRYDTADYEEVDAYAGSLDDLKELCCEAHKRGMKVILDAVFNHTGNDSKYFNEYGSFDSLGAYQSSDSPYYDFYRKNNGHFDYWWGMKNLPVCDGNSVHWINYITGSGGVIDKWFSLGIDGLRLDVADELTDDFIERIREAVKRNKEDGFILGEVWKNPMKMNRGYISSGKGMDTVMNYSFIDALIRYYKFCDTDKLDRVIKEILSDYPDETIYSLMNFTSTHDISRSIDIFSSYVFSPNREWVWDVDNSNHEFLRNHNLSEEEYRRGMKIYRSYLFALTFLPGNLSIFYGDEAGLEGLGNLLNRRCFPWGMEDDKLISYFRFLGNIREDNPSLEKAPLRIKDLNPNFMMFERLCEDGDFLVVTSRSDKNSRIFIPPEYESCSKTYIVGNSTKDDLSPYGAIALKKRK